MNDPATIRAHRHEGETRREVDAGGFGLQDRHRLGETLAALGERAALPQDVRELGEAGTLADAVADRAERGDRLAVASLGVLVATRVLDRLRLEVERARALRMVRGQEGEDLVETHRRARDVQGHRVLARHHQGPARGHPERVDGLAARPRD